MDGCSGFENLKILASIRNALSSDEIRETITRVGLDPENKKAFKKYSLGMKQRLELPRLFWSVPT